MKMKHILGTVTIVVIIGGTIYAIKKNKDLQKTEDGEISLKEAKEIVAEREAFDNAHSKDEIIFTAGPITVNNVPTSFELHEIEELDDEEMQILKEGVRETASFEANNDIDEEDFDDDDIEGPTINDNVIGIFTEEDRTLRYEPSSLDALKQFKRMELADLGYNSETYQTMLRLFDFPFKPINDGDNVLYTQIIDYRVQFFGFGSNWSQHITFADVILHYARAAQFNCDETVEYWVDYFLEFNDLYYQYSSSTIDVAINTLNAHQYFNEERQTFGLFGLTRESMDQAIKLANRNFDSSVTYEIEFNEFLKSII
jgi:hypothetical protein